MITLCIYNIHDTGRDFLYSFKISYLDYGITIAECQYEYLASTNTIIKKSSRSNFSNFDYNIIDFSQYPEKVSKIIELMSVENNNKVFRYTNDEWVFFED